MATLHDVFTHLVRHSPGLSDDNRQEFFDVIDEKMGEKKPEQSKSSQSQSSQSQSQSGGSS